MAQNLNINGAIFPFPEDGEDNWGPVVTAWANAVSTGLLQKSGGSFTLTAEVVFGDNFSLKGKYFKFISGVLSDNKIVNLKAPATPIASSYDLILPTSQGSQHSVLKYGLLGQLEHGKITDANINENADINTSKLLALTPDRILKTSSSGKLEVNPAITAARVLISDSSGFPVASTVTDVELSYLSGATSNIQDQLDLVDPAFISALITQVGDLDSEVVKKAGTQTITGAKTFSAPVIMTKETIAALEVDASLGNFFTKTLSANSTLTIVNMVVGQSIMIHIDNTSSNYIDITLPSNCLFSTGASVDSIPPLSESIITITKVSTLSLASTISGPK